MRHLAAVVLCTVLLSACITVPQQKAKPTNVALPELGTEYVGTFTVAGKSFPLPKGTFTLTGTDITMTSKSGYAVGAFLVRHRRGTVQQGVEIYTNLPLNYESGPARNGWATHQGCQRDDMHHRQTFNNVRLGKQDCWWVNHWRMHRTGSRYNEHWQETVKYLKEKDLKAPIEMVAVSYRIANKTDYATLHYFFNPQTASLEGDFYDHWSLDSWSESAWHKDNINDSPKRKAFVNSRIAWGEKWHSKMRSVLK